MKKIEEDTVKTLYDSLTQEEKKELDFLVTLIPEGFKIGGDGNYQEISDKLNKGRIYHKL